MCEGRVFIPFENIVLKYAEKYINTVNKYITIIAFIYTLIFTHVYLHRIAFKYCPSVCVCVEVRVHMCVHEHIMYMCECVCM